MDEPWRRSHCFPQPGPVLPGMAVNLCVHLTASGALLLKTWVSSTWHPAFPNSPTWRTTGGSLPWPQCVSLKPLSIFPARRAAMLHCNVLESMFAHHLSLVVWGDSRLLWRVVGSTRLLEAPYRSPSKYRPMESCYCSEAMGTTQGACHIRKFQNIVI